MARGEELDKSSWIVTLASIAVVVAALYWAKGILIPLTVAVLLSFLLSPVCDWLERRKLGRIPAVLMTAILAFALLGIVAWTSSGCERLRPRYVEESDADREADRARPHFRGKR
jgi:predicted PurR-regulated permease PerM